MTVSISVLLLTSDHLIYQRVEKKINFFMFSHYSVVGINIEYLTFLKKKLYVKHIVLQLGLYIKRMFTY